MTAFLGIGRTPPCRTVHPASRIPLPAEREKKRREQDEKLVFSCVSSCAWGRARALSVLLLLSPSSLLLFFIVIVNYEYSVVQGGGSTTTTSGITTIASAGTVIAALVGAILILLPRRCFSYGRNTAHARNVLSVVQYFERLPGQ